MTPFEPRLSIVTLGVSSISRSRRFYEQGLGWKASKASNEHVVFLKTWGTIIALHPRKLLAQDATVPAEGAGFSGITLAHNVRTKKQVSLTLETARRAGAKIIKPAQDVFWGGHSGYFSDPDGHLWEVAWNPFFKIGARGQLKLP